MPILQRDSQHESINPEVRNVNRLHVAHTAAATRLVLIDENNFDGAALLDGKLICLPESPIVLEDFFDDYDEIPEDEYEQWLLDEYLADQTEEEDQ